MDFDYDVVIVGGAFSGAATAQLIRRKQPNARVLIIEKSAEFDRKVGESFSALPYYSEKVCGDGWACVGDAAGFIDPLYSPGLDFCSYTSNYVADFVARSVAGEDVTASVSHYNQQYPIMYRSWFETLFKDKYYYIADAELMSAAFLLDVASYYLGARDSSIPRSGARISRAAVPGTNRRNRSKGDAILQSPAGRIGETPPRHGTLRQAQFRLARIE